MRISPCCFIRLLKCVLYVPPNQVQPPLQQQQRQVNTNSFSNFNSNNNPGQFGIGIRQVPETVVANFLPNQQQLLASASTHSVRTFHGKQAMAPLFGVNQYPGAQNFAEEFLLSCLLCAVFSISGKILYFLSLRCYLSLLLHLSTSLLCALRVFFNYGMGTMCTQFLRLNFFAQNVF